VYFLAMCVKCQYFSCLYFILYQLSQWRHYTTVLCLTTSHSRNQHRILQKRHQNTEIAAHMWIYSSKYSTLPIHRQLLSIISKFMNNSYHHTVGWTVGYLHTSYTWVHWLQCEYFIQCLGSGVWGQDYEFSFGPSDLSEWAVLNPAVRTTSHFGRQAEWLVPS